MIRIVNLYAKNVCFFFFVFLINFPLFKKECIALRYLLQTLWYLIMFMRILQDTKWIKCKIYSHFIHIMWWICFIYFSYKELSNGVLAELKLWSNRQQKKPDGVIIEKVRARYILFLLCDLRLSFSVMGWSYSHIMTKMLPFFLL